MKKTKQNNGSMKKKTVKIAEEKSLENTEKAKGTGKSIPLDEDDQGFGGWLKSSDGLETLKLFVIANSVVMLTTVVYPHIHTAFEIVYDMIYGTDSLF